MAFHDAILRGESEFTAAERELIAAYTSVLNACDFCHGSHQIIAGFHGIEPAVSANLVSDLTQAGLEENWLPLLAYVDKLTESPARLTGGDVQAVFAAGWSEDALYDAIVVGATFNLMNRIVEGCEVWPAAEGRAASRERHQAVKSSDLPYTYSGRLFGIDPD
ncbi:MAG: peroxidase [Gammaproteobacteria bacterium]